MLASDVMLKLLITIFESEQKGETLHGVDASCAFYAWKHRHDPVRLAHDAFNKIDLSKERLSSPFTVVKIWSGLEVKLL